MIMCSIILLILSSQLKRALRSNSRKYQKKNNILNQKISSNNLKETALLKALLISQT